MESIKVSLRYTANSVAFNVVHGRFTPARLPSVTNLAKPTVDHVRESVRGWLGVINLH